MSRMSSVEPVVHIVGAGLAGSEAAWQVARAGIRVVLHEMRPVRQTPAHQTDKCAELVCSNSFRSSDSVHNAVGLLHAEMRLCDSLILQTADSHALPAGGALAVDREGFSESVSAALADHPLITLAREEIAGLPPPEWAHVIIATGPLTSPALAQEIATVSGAESLAFFDAIAPIVYRETIDFDHAWFQSRYDKGEGSDYINCPFDERADYERFVAALREAQTTDFREWEKDTPYFEGCMPVEVMAERGVDTLRFGPMKPVGLSNPRATRRPWAVVQLRQDNALGTLYNMVGFQTKMKYAEQTRVFRMIPGLAHAEFARLGGLHRNIFLNAPRVLDSCLRLKAMPRLRFAGQITGCEGYVESSAMGLLAGRMAVADIHGRDFVPPPPETALGALLGHITGGARAESFQPMNINFGLFPPPPADVRLKGVERKTYLTDRARAEMAAWLKAA